MCVCVCVCESVNEMCLREKLFVTENSIDILHANLAIGLIRDVKKTPKQRISVGKDRLRNLKEVLLELQDPAARFIPLMTLWRIRQPTKQLTASPE